MQHTNIRTLDMTEGIIWKQLLLFAIPLVLGDLLQQLYNAADSIIVGQFVSKQALAAVTSTETIVTTVVGMFTGISTGATIIIAQFFGSKDLEKVHAAVHTTISLTCILCGLLTCIGVCGTPLMLHLLSTTDDVYPLASSYLRIYFAGISGLILYNMCSGILRAIGDSRRPLMALLIASILNIGLDLLFIVVFRWGVVGAAAATIIAQFASAFYLLAILCFTKEHYRLDLHRLCINKSIMMQILKVGVPVGLQKTIVSFSNTMVVSRINRFGSGAMAAWGVFRKMDQAIIHIAQSVSLSISAFVGQNIGALRNDRIQKGILTAFCLSIAIVMGLVSFMLPFRYQLISLFNTEPDVLSYGSQMFCQMMPFQWLACVTQVQAGTLRGRGDSTGPMVIMTFSYTVVRQFYLYVGWCFWPSISLVLSSYVFTWIFAAVSMLAYSKWRHS